MTETMHDRMVARTRQLLKETLLLMMEETGFSDVTVRDLTLKANVNRGTFYLHYRDKYDLIEQMEDELLVGLQKNMNSLNYQEMLECSKLNIPYSPLVEVFQYLNANGRILKSLLGTKGDPAFPHKLKLSLNNGIFEVLNDRIHDPSIPNAYVSAFATSALLGIIEYWLNNEMRQTPEEIALIYLKIKFYHLQ
ncbi:TetR/AcrR family transcriptional regulator [Paenibacillus doosanensis]|uniref:TetR/AcrR family transcriptional regulator n=1 Tax=Paenibacillus doosanensis TaxID=1229154 RepID=UPI00217F77EA|nr:TetR/AcrR family transcriptional regulator [Paenibacillus doosanensis]MCS7461291.1 TetR/AcrR family transcriptional regulator [Paenibacillus doosanensis]